ncbi:hypothetical protein BASA61_006828 [Batrachochytrium salamandrivorans]|nr:hypothetical protein BASA61_006828 [Batrachochytrium salamandrivorans]
MQRRIQGLVYDSSHTRLIQKLVARLTRMLDVLVVYTILVNRGAIMLFEVLWNLIDKLGFEPDFTKSKSGKGNTVFMQLLIDGMKLQPCNPNFIQARDAIIQADKNNNGGAHFCEIQKGFAARGLGTGARAGNFVNSFTVDSRCS